MAEKRVIVIGGGLAGCEAAHWLACHGVRVDLHEMRPEKKTEAHQTGDLAELVCSNSFKSLSLSTAPGILKRELEIVGSLAIESARKAAIGAGEALAVDRDVFAAAMTESISVHPLISLHRGEMVSLPMDPEVPVILATGPLTSPLLTESLRNLTGDAGFYFYDAISPIVDAGSIQMDKAWIANRYGKPTRSVEGTTDQGEGDYINCPLTKEEYEKFVNELLRAERVPTKDFERVKHFEGCMPIEEMADRGIDTLRHGPMKPVGLVDPRTGQEPWAAVQLRPENISRSAYNIVGFQTKLKYGEQQRLFRTIPGLGEAEFLRLGSMHRNSYVDGPRALSPDLSLRRARHIHLAGQITGVEGYMESAACGLLAGIFVQARLENRPIPAPPAGSALGSLLAHVTNGRNTDYQPSSINFSLFEDHHFPEALEELRKMFPTKKKFPKPEKREAIGRVALRNVAQWKLRLDGNVL